MNKVYVETSKYKINGQEIIQKALAEAARAQDFSASKNDADILIYSQFDEKLYNEAKNSKKKVLFCHHYTAASVFSKCFVIKENCLDVITHHIVPSVYSELYEYLVKKGVAESSISVVDFAAINYNTYKSAKASRCYDLIYVGRYDKGFSNFVDYVNAFNITKSVALCPDAHKYHYDIPCKVYSNITGKDVYKFLERSKFIYSYSSYNVPKHHLEITMQEAIMCGCVNLVDNMYNYVLNTNDVTKYGFTKTMNITDEQRASYAALQKQLLSTYKTRAQVLNEVLCIAAVL